MINRTQLPLLHLMPRAHQEVENCIAFVARQPCGRPRERLLDIYRAFDVILEWPKLRPVGVRRPASGLELRRYAVAQFAIIYAYIPPSPAFRNGIVSIRAIRHGRVKNVFAGVKESTAPAYAC